MFRYTDSYVKKAQEWVEKYPFLRFKDNSCCPWESTEKVENCWIFELPEGWIKGFGKQMCDELRNALGEHIDDFVIQQVKEKHNQVVWYWCWEDRDYTDEETNELNKLYGLIENIIDKYAQISYNTCTVCGEPANKWTSGWITSFCNKCYKKYIEERRR